MKCVLLDGCVAFFKGLRVLHVFSTYTGGIQQVLLPLTELAAGQEIPTSHGWRLVNQAREKTSGAKMRRRPRKRH